MKPKFIYANKSEIPAAFAEFYREEGGKWILDVDGAADAEKLREFRENNIQLKTKLEAYGDITPEQAKEWKGKAAELEQAGIKDKGELQKKHEAQLAQLKQEHATELSKRDTSLAAKDKELATLKIDGELTRIATEMGVRPEAIPDVIGRGRNVFSLGADGKIEAKKPDGTTYYGRGAEPLSIKEWTEGLTKEAAHLFTPSQGGGSPGGAGGGNKGGGHTGPNPFAKDTWNLTQQGQLYKADPQNAIKLAAQAGITLPPPAGTAAAS